MPNGSKPQIDTHEALSLATACAKRGELEAAMIHLKGLLAVDPEHEIATGMLAAIYAQLNMTGRAVEYFRRVLAINPQNPLARAQLELLERSGKPLNP